MQNGQAASATKAPVNNTGALVQIMMLQIVQKMQKMAASMDLFPTVIAPSLLLRTHEPTVYATRQSTDEIFSSTPSLSRRLYEDLEDEIAIPVCAVSV